MLNKFTSILILTTAVLSTNAIAGTVNITAGPATGVFTSGGLNGQYTQDPSDPGSVGAAISYLNTNGAEATFLATTIDYGVDDSPSESVGSFFGSNVSGLDPSSVTSNIASGTILDLTGYIDITSADIANGVNLSISSDDGSLLYVGGTEVIDDDGEHGGGFSSPVTLTFANGAGYYGIEIQYFENYVGPATLGLAGDIFTGPTTCSLCEAGVPGGMALASEADLFTTTSTPEPASLLLAGAGLAGFAALRRRKRA